VPRPEDQAAQSTILRSFVETEEAAQRAASDAARLRVELAKEKDERRMASAVAEVAVRCDAVVSRLDVLPQLAGWKGTLGVEMATYLMREELQVVLDELAAAKQRAKTLRIAAARTEE